MTPSRRHLFALLGLVLPAAAFAAAPASAATSTRRTTNRARIIDHFAQGETAPCRQCTMHRIARRTGPPQGVAAELSAA